MPLRASTELLRYSVGIALPAAAMVVCTLLGNSADPSVSFAIYLLAVGAAAWFGGLGPGVLAALLSALLRARFPSVPFAEFAGRDLLGAVFFGATGIGAAVLTSRLRDARAAAPDPSPAPEVGRGMLENLPDLVWMATADGTSEWFNHRWATYTGRSVIDWRDPIAPEDRPRAEAAWLLAHAQGKPLSIEVRLLRGDNTWRWHLVRVQPLRESAMDSAIRGWSGSCTDIDDQKRAEAMLRTTQQRISAFLGTLSHELRNPLAAVSSAVQVLRHPRAAPEMTARALETLDRQATLLSRMVDELLDAARLMEGRIDLQRRCVALNELLREVCVDLSARANEKGVTLHCEVPERQILVDADLLRIKQAVENLVINALHACAAGETVTVSVIEGQPGEAGIRVADTGCGLSTDSLAALFEPGSSTSRADKATGLGLGLKAVHRIMQLHGGRVVAHSDGEGKGATFDLFFPLYDAAAATNVAQSQPASAALLADQRILIISNAVADIDPLLAPIEHCAAEVRWATHGFEGLRIAAAWPPTALVCDLELPSPLSGYDVLRQILALPPERRPRLVAIGDDDTVDIEQARAAGFDDCLIRPISLSRLLGTLAQAGSRTAAMN